MQKTPTQDAAFRLKSLLHSKGPHVVPRGELWIGSAFLACAGLADTLDNHFQIAAQLGQEMVCLPVLERPERNAQLGYRYFVPKELSRGLRDRTRFLVAIIDGPFQRMVNQRGLMPVLMSWTEEREETMAAYTQEQKIAMELIDRCLAKGVDAIILADDLAGEKAPFVNPLELDDVCTPFYVRAVASIRAAGSFVFLHCCGNLGQLVPLLKSWDFDGLAAIQIGKNDLDLLDKEIGGLLIAGIEAALLETDVPEREEMENLQRFVARFAEQGRLILSSSCGLFSSDFWGRFQRVYEGLDKNQLDDCHTTNESRPPF
jgi:uroporphyrinogen decarboxylase